MCQNLHEAEDRGEFATPVSMFGYDIVDYDTDGRPYIQDDLHRPATAAYRAYVYPSDYHYAYDDSTVTARFVEEAEEEKEEDDKEQEQESQQEHHEQTPPPQVFRTASLSTYLHSRRRPLPTMTTERRKRTARIMNAATEERGRECMMLPPVDVDTDTDDSSNDDDSNRFGAKIPRFYFGNPWP